MSDEVSILRAAERIVHAGGGLMLIYFGYKLFLKASVTQQSKGVLKSQLLTLTFTSVGPGLFFALAGAGVLYAGIQSRVIVESNTREIVSTPAQVRPRAGADRPDRPTGFFDTDELPPETSPSSPIRIEERRTANFRPSPQMDFTPQRPALLPLRGEKFGGRSAGRRSDEP